MIHFTFDGYTTGAVIIYMIIGYAIARLAYRVRHYSIDQMCVVASRELQHEENRVIFGDDAPAYAPRTFCGLDKIAWLGLVATLLYTIAACVYISGLVRAFSMVNIY